MEKQFIDECEYKGLLEKVKYGSDSLEEAIDIFEYLKDKRTVETELFRGKVPVEYPHIKFLSYILNSTISDFAAGFSESDEEFLQSEYLQNQLKIEISRMLKNSSQELMELVNSDKNIKDFSKEELKGIIGTLDNIGKSLEGEEKEFYEDFHYIFEDYLFELGGQGPVEYTKEIHGRELPKEMLERSNVRSMPSYYSGYSVDSGLLGERHLFSLYKKFVKFYPDKVDNFVRMVMSTSKLTPTEFVTNYLMFAAKGLNNNFESKKGNISVDGLHGESRDLVGAISIFSAFKEKNDLDIYFEDRKDSSIRRRFNEKIVEYKKLQEAKKSDDDDKNVFEKK